MKAPMKSSMALAGALLLFGSTAARANQLDVTVPFAFLVNGETLPAGTYRVETVGTMLLIHGEKGTRGGAVAETMTASGQDPAGTRPALTFSRHDNQIRLTGVWQSRGDGLAVNGR